MVYNNVYNMQCGGRCADSESLLRILENDTILKHDSVWPYGLNFRLSVTSFVELVQLRTSCQRHRWPPTSRDRDPDVDDVNQVQGRLCERLRLAVSMQACSFSRNVSRYFGRHNAGRSLEST